LAKDNEAQALTFDILSRKLDLFGTVLDASDSVLHRGEGGGPTLVSALGAEFEAELRKIYERARTLAEVTAELRALRDRVSEERRRFEETHQRTASLVEERLDETVQRVLRARRDSIPPALAALDRDLRAVVVSWLEERNIQHTITHLESDAGSAELLEVSTSPLLPAELRDGVRVVVGASKDHSSLHLTHPLVVAAVADARAAPAFLSGTVTLAADAPASLRSCVRKRGRVRLTRLSFDGFEREERLVPVAVFEDGTVLEANDARLLLESALCPAEVGSVAVAAEALRDAVEQELFVIQSLVDESEQSRFARASRQAENYVEDRLVVLRGRKLELLEKIEVAEQLLSGAIGAVARDEAEQVQRQLQVKIDELEGAIARLEQRDEATYRSYREQIERRRFAPPTIELLFDLDLVVTGAEP
ncbi:MAG: hypothetical protein JST92_27855, partial [Deltaproteobacteria bacterium]|nr:hypothetical protein [Deltaproteobacteria bacterium]